MNYSVCVSHKAADIDKGPINLNVKLEGVTYGEDMSDHSFHLEYDTSHIYTFKVFFLLYSKRLKS